MKKFFSTLLASIIGTGLVLVILVFILIGIMSAASESEIVEIKEKTVLMLELDNPIVDKKSNKPFGDFGDPLSGPEKQIGLNKILENIKKASADENIDGIFLKLSTLRAGIATIEEIRSALTSFQDSGKYVICHADYFTHSSYYLGTVADELYMTPEGELGFLGLSAELIFFKRLFEKLGVEPIALRHGKFKSGIEPYILEKMSEANKEQLTVLIGTIWNNMLANISKERSISVDRLNEIADELLVKDANSAVELGMLDALKYYDEILSNLQEKTGAEKTKDINFVSLSDYSKVPKKRKDGEKGLAKDKIAVIYASGEIRMGEGNESIIGSEGLARTIREVRNDKKVKAIVLRINSPGGSPLASEVILREVKEAKKVKPVIVSMGNYAASGGYYIACAADTIVADANTLTGSIGVYGVLYNFENLLNNKIGITTDRIETNEHSSLWSNMRRIEPAEEAFVMNSIERIYDTFITHVAEGRNMTAEQVDEIGQGRVWSGTDAKKIGLVDEIGGLERAIEIAAEKAELERYRTSEYPKEKEMFEAIMEMMNAKVNGSVVEKELGDFANYYKVFKSVSGQKGIQARLPFELKMY